MNKILWLIVLLCAAWTVKLSVDVYSLRDQKIAELNGQVEQQTQKIAKLNDQLVALQVLRPKEQVVEVPSQNIEQTEKSYSALAYVQDRLQFTQSLMQQQYYSEALEQIQLLKKQLLEQDLLSSSLKQTLLEAFSKDQLLITTYLQERNEHIQILQQQLQQIEKALQARPLAPAQNKWQLSTWFSFGKADKIPEYYHRAIYFKQLQLQILVAQQALYAGEITFYHAQLQEIVEGLSRYPDSTARSIVAAIQRLDTQALSKPPQLSAVTLVQE